MKVDDSRSAHRGRRRQPRIDRARRHHISSSTPAHTTLSLYDLGRGGGGALTIERELSRLPGVARVCVNPLTEMAYVEYDAARCSRAELSAALRRTGYGGHTP